MTQEVVISDADDPDQQTLLIRYPIATTEVEEGYVRPTVKIEAGAKSALDPHRQTIIKPYIADEMAMVNLAVENIVTIDAERTFWDKVVILHGLRRWHDNRKQLRQQGHRISRHYQAMAVMIFGEVPDFALVMHKIVELEQQINQI